jgi:diaminohydroxyphosphoribosylaminopyrimidine deaminase/5-amino-6-(5-phosphoribosylamino)uracil reductase
VTPAGKKLNEKSNDSSNERFMRTSLRLAGRGVSLTSPNPAVGAVVVKGNKIIARGWHRRAGLPHAEVTALGKAGRRARGADLYVTLEPCCHHGRTPPCTAAITAAGVKRVYVGMKDPNPRVRGKGIKVLQKAGIEVTNGILEKRCRALNEAYIKYITTASPFVTLKLASTLDGRIATGTGESRWLTGIGARRFVHRMRSDGFKRRPRAYSKAR